MAKKSNIESVKGLLDGTHHTQTRTVTGYTKEADKRRFVGEEWFAVVDGHRYKFKQHEGFRTKQSANSAALGQFRNALKMPNTCPDCKDNMNGDERSLNKQFWPKFHKCFSCVTKEETLIRAKGVDAWAEYAKTYQLNNAKAWLKDTDAEVEDIIKGIKGFSTVADADGTMETWKNANADQEIEFLKSNYSKFKERLIAKFS